MCCGKCFSIIKSFIIQFSILIIFLFQLYSQYSTLITYRTRIHNEKDGRNTLSYYHLTKNLEYDFNINKLQECFEDNPLMNINFVKEKTLDLFDKLNANKETKTDQRNYMLYYLIIYDIFNLIIVYCFIYGSIQAGIIKIILQGFRFYFNAKRIQRFNNEMNLYYIIKYKIENICVLRKWNFFNPEGFLVIEFLCNFVIILDIILLIILFRKKYSNKSQNKNYIILEEKNKDDLSEDDLDKSDNNSLDKSNENNIDKSNSNVSSNNISNGNNNKKKEPQILNIFEEEEEDDEEDNNISDEVEVKKNKNNKYN
jgi:hypothetical protein